MGRRAKSPKGKTGPERSFARKSPKSEGARVRDLEKRLAEALEQQTATSEVLRIIAVARELQPVFDAISLRAATLCAADNGAVALVEGGLFTVGGNYGFPEALLRSYPRPVDTTTINGRAVLERRTIHVPDFDAPDAPDSVVIRDLRHAPLAPGTRLFRSQVSVPMLRGDEAIGVMVLARYEPKAFSEAQIELLKTFADQAVIAIENVRLFKELEARNRDLTESLGRETATSEILRVISQSQTDVQPVFETMAANALRLCDAELSAVFRFDGELIHLVALNQFSPEGAAALRDAFPMRPGKGSNTARAILTRGIAHIPDLLKDPEYVLQGLAQRANYRSNLSVPMLRDGHPIGAITVAKAEPGPFPDKQIELLKGLRRPGRHRHRERAAVQGVGGADG